MGQEEEEWSGELELLLLHKLIRTSGGEKEEGMWNNNTDFSLRTRASAGAAVGALDGGILMGCGASTRSWTELLL